MGDEEKVLATFLTLKEKNSSYELKTINNHYYVYLSSGRWDGALGKMKKVSIYKGRIAEDGTFVAIKHKRKIHEKRTVLVAEPATLIESNPNIPLKEDAKIRQNSYKYEKTILTALSMNGRISLPMLSKMLGLSVNATDWQVRSIERRYGIKYVPEIDVTKFGYMQFFLAVKFLGKIPQVDELKSLLQKEPRIQMAMTLKGDFDLLIYVLAKSVEELNNDIIIGISKAIGDYDCMWTTIPFYEDYGFIPVRDEFIDFLKDKLLSREYAVLKQLNNNGKCEFSEIDTKHGFDRGRTNYSYYKLREEGKIRHITILMQRLPIAYNGIIIGTMTNRWQFEKSRRELLCNIIEDYEPQADRYTFVCDTVNPYGIMFFLPIRGNINFDKTVESLSSLGSGMRFTTLIITSILVGDFCYRKFDAAHSVQQRILEKEYGRPRAQRLDYEESGRKKVHAMKVDIRGARIAQNAA